MNKNSLFFELRQSGKYLQKRVRTKKEKQNSRQNLKKSLRNEGFDFPKVA